MFSYLRFRYHRLARRWRRGFRLFEQWSVNYINRHLSGKWYLLGIARRFLLVWVAIIVIAFIGVTRQVSALERAGQVAAPQPGGTYVEAAQGMVQVLNPVLPESTTASDINSLIFSGLTRYNAKRQPVPDLATSWNASADGLNYTFHLRHGVKWHDGVAFTSADVAFTLTAIQDPDSRSPLASSWQGVGVSTPDPFTVVFKLPTPLASFIDSTTLGIVPRHILGEVNPSELATTHFDQAPIGTGPFKMKTFAPSAHDIELVANPNYYFGKPKLAGFAFKFYPSAEVALTAYVQNEVTSPGEILPSEAAQRAREVGLTDYQMTLPDETALFFNNADSVLGDKTLRGIISAALNRPAILNAATGGQGLVATQPLLPGQLGYTNQYAPALLGVGQAKAALTADGWVTAKANSVRTKSGKPLKLTLVTKAGGELQQAANEIKRQLTPLGVDVVVQATSLEDLQQSHMRPRNFQILLFGMNVGADPDVYAYWHSSQAKDPGVNLSGYSSPAADKALEAGRVKTDPAIREVKYHEFLQAWDADAPAAVLYETGYIYDTRDTVSGITAHQLVTPADRFFNVQNWTVNRRWVK